MMHRFQIRAVNGGIDIWDTLYNRRVVGPFADLDKARKLCKEMNKDVSTKN